MNDGNTISLPKGGGAVSGLGETFSPDLFTGTGNFSVPIEVPPGRNNFQPQLSLVYSTGNGISPFGLGWDLSIPGVSRKTSKGIPRYLGEDTFILSGAEDLVPVQKEAGFTRYQPRTEGLFAKIDRHLDAKTDYWKVRSKEGLTSYYGTDESRKKDTAVIADPNNQSKVFAWKLTKTEDSFGNQIVYTYLRDSGENYDQLYLHEIRYVNYDEDQDGKNPKFLLTIRFNYDELPEQQNIYPSSDHRAGFEIRTTKRCTSIEIYSNPDALPQDELTQEQLTRSYHFKYQDQLSATELNQLDLTIIPKNGLSYLHQIEVTGHNGQKTETLPAPRFSYSTFNPEQRTFTPLASTNLPTQSLADPNIELVDLFGNGLPDILETKGTIRYWRNLGNGNFDMPRKMKEAPTALNLATEGVQILDANGDGRPDLMVSNTQMNGYFSSEAGALWDRRSFQPYRNAPSFSLQDPQVKLIDLNGDGVTDALRSGSRFELFYNDAEKGWSETQQISRKDLEHFPNVNFADQRVKWADMSGDRLTDIVLIHDGNVEYWPYQGYGKWGDRVHMHNSPRFPYGYDPQRIFLGDVDGSGNADLIYIDHSKVTLWLNQAGKGWSDPIEIDGTPPVTNPSAIRLIDLHGSGVSGLLWTDDKRASRNHYYFLDFTGGIKPYLLTEMDNRLGALTRVHYESSIRSYLKDEKRPETRWQSTLPFPVQVVSRVESIDLISQGKLTTEYSYHHGYWDGEEREFRGFGRVDQRDTESFENYHQSSSTTKALNFNGVEAQYFSAPTETRTWFHQGPVSKKGGDWNSSSYQHEYWLGDPGQLESLYDQQSFLKTLQPQDRRDALRTLRGTVLRSETYALDGSAREQTPYTVTESASQLKEISAPEQNQFNRKRIFFPFPVVNRTTQWERGDHPMTQFSFTSDYDDYGQPRKSWQIACPNGWLDRFSQKEGYLATYSETSFAQRDDDNVYIVDRTAESKAYELKLHAPQTLIQIKQSVETDQIDKQLIGHSLNFYDGDKYTGLALKKMGEHGIPARSETLVLTKEILKQIHGDKIPAYFSENGQASLGNEYPQEFIDNLQIKNSSDATRPGLTITPLAYGFADGRTAPYTQGYYATGERQDFNDKGMVVSSIDPYGHESTIIYDQYNFLPTVATNPIGLNVKAEYNYRTLQVAQMTDANGNQSSASYSPLGMIQSTQINGKAGEKVGDRADQPSTRYLYDFDAFTKSQQENKPPQPNYVHTIQRTEHAWMLIDQENKQRANSNQPEMTEAEINDFFKGEEDNHPERFIQSREYSDGFGRLIQTRVLAAETQFVDDTLPEKQSNETETKKTVTAIKNTNNKQPNVIVNGWQTFNNKGQVVEQYEPFYHTGWDYLDRSEAKAEQLGEKATLFYDPRGQVIRTKNPDGSEQRVIYGIPKDINNPDLFDPTPWQAYTYDANDNAGRTHSATSQGYQSHWNTPAHIEIDPLGRAILAVERLDNSDTEQSKVTTKSRYDILGNLLEVTDAKNRKAFVYHYSLVPESSPLRIDSIDAGQRWITVDATGQEVERRDSKGSLILQNVDTLLRPSHFWARDDEAGTVSLRQHSVYGDGGEKIDESDPKYKEAQSKNTLGQLIQHYDEAGSVSTTGFDFKGNPLDSTRQVIADKHLLKGIENGANNNWNIKAFQVNWQPSVNSTIEAHATQLLNPTQYTTSSRFDALNRATEVLYPENVENHRAKLTPSYNHSGVLESVALDGKPYVERIAYNAKGQRILIAYGNGALTRYHYSADTFRLDRLRTEKFNKTNHAADPLSYQPAGVVLQDFAYHYDLNGNILGIKDRSPECGVHDPAININELDRVFSYDPLSRLISATGRESDKALSNPDGPELPHHNDVTKTRAYTQQYSYDKMGNMQQLKHQHGASSVNNRNFTVEENNNRLKSIDFSGTNFAYDYDVNGNMTKEGLSRHFEWNHSDQMKAFRTQAGNSEPSVHAQYLYDASGLRVMKLVRKQDGMFETRVYIGELFEHFRWGLNTANNNVSNQGENNILHVMDDQQRIALVRKGLKHPSDEGKAVQFHLGDHLGSSNLVLDEVGALMNREEHYPYGETSFGSFARKRYRFTGKERDEESGLNYHAARYYS
ncbi:Putative insecticidal toxin complex, partial [hydrothermal vent metagenome]